MDKTLHSELIARVKGIKSKRADRYKALGERLDKHEVRDDEVGRRLEAEVEADENLVKELEEELSEELPLGNGPEVKDKQTIHVDEVGDVDEVNGLIGMRGDGDTVTKFPIADKTTKDTAA
jgi:hypothetical protein